MRVICPQCGTVIDPSDRCESLRASGRCMELQGHEGYHWTDFGSSDGSVTIWTGIYVFRSCPGRLSLSDWCKKPAGHAGAHNNGRGMSFDDPADEPT